MSPDDDLRRESFELHQMLLDGDPTAPARLAEIYIPLMVHRLSDRYPLIADKHLIETAVHDAFLNYIDRPEQYNPTLLPLDSYLRMSADGDLRNHLQKSQRQNCPKILGRIVELDALSAEQEIRDEHGPALENEVLDRNSSLWEQLGAIISDPKDYEFVMLMLENERSTTEYAIVLGISHLPFDEQAREVKRNKDRLKKQLQRHIRRVDIDNND